MGSYIINFTVYTMAMCGLIFFALFVYKKFATSSFCAKKSQFLGVEDTLSLAPRKMLYIVRAGEERFLIASDADKTSLISKLQNGENMNFASQLQQTQMMSAESYRRKENSQPQMQSTRNQEKTKFIGIDDLPTIVPRGQAPGKSHDVLKSMVSRIKD